MTDTGGCIVRALALSLVCLAAAGERAGAQPDTFHGSSTVRVNDEPLIIERLDWPRFRAFAEESLARHYKLGGKVKVEGSASTDPIVDIELRGPSKCLATDISRNGWQKLRLEFSYKSDFDFFADTGLMRYQFLVRFVSGYIADYPWADEPPPERYKQILPRDLEDLARKLAGFMLVEVTQPCFDKQNLRYCPKTLAEPCP